MASVTRAVQTLTLVMLVLAYTMEAGGGVAAQSFQYSRGWHAGKRPSAPASSAFSYSFKENGADVEQRPAVKNSIVGLILRMGRLIPWR